MDGEIVKSAKGNAKGVIIDGLGCGNVPPECKKAIAELRKTGIPVVLTTRVPTGSIMEEYSYDGSCLLYTSFSSVALRTAAAMSS